MFSDRRPLRRVRIVPTPTHSCGSVFKLEVRKKVYSEALHSSKEKLALIELSIRDDMST
jgi:hypothetical protein